MKWISLAQMLFISDKIKFFSASNVTWSIQFNYILAIYLYIYLIHILSIVHFPFSYSPIP